MVLNYQIANIGLGYHEKTGSYSVSIFVLQLGFETLNFDFLCFDCPFAGRDTEIGTEADLTLKKVFYFSQWFPIFCGVLAILPEEKYVASNI